MNDLVSN